MNQADNTSSNDASSSQSSNAAASSGISPADIPDITSSSRKRDRDEEHNSSSKRTRANVMSTELKLPDTISSVLDLPDQSHSSLIVTYTGLHQIGTESAIYFTEKEADTDMDNFYRMFAQGYGEGRDGKLADASFTKIVSMCLDVNGSIFIAEEKVLRMISNRTVSTLAGSDIFCIDIKDGVNARFGKIRDIIYSPLDKSIVINDNGFSIRKYHLETGLVSTVAGSRRRHQDGYGVWAQFYYITAIGMLSNGTIVVAERNCIRLIQSTGSGKEVYVSTIAGSYTCGYTRATHFYDGSTLPSKSTKGPFFFNGGTTEIGFSSITGLLVDGNDNIYVSDDVGTLTSIRKLTKSGSSYVVSTLLVTGQIKGKLSSFTKDGDMILCGLNTDVDPDNHFGKLYFVKNDCVLPAYLRDLYHGKASFLEEKPLSRSQQRSHFFDNAADNMPNFTFKIAGKSIPVHQGVLMMGSKYFLQMFKSSMTGGDNTSTEVKETTYEALRAVLKYIYTRDFTDLLTHDNVFDVFGLSDKYLLVELQEHCVRYLQTTDEALRICYRDESDLLSADNVLDAYDLSVRCNLILVQDHCIGYMQASSMEATVKWIIACRSKPTFERVETVLNSKIGDNFGILEEKHPLLHEELQRRYANEGFPETWHSREI